MRRLDGFGYGYGTGYSKNIEHPSLVVLLVDDNPLTVAGQFATMFSSNP